MSQSQNPLIRVPTQPARLTVFVLIQFLTSWTGIIWGGLGGYQHFGIWGGVLGAVAGGILGIIIGTIPGFLSQEAMFRRMQKSTNTELRAELEKPWWNFWQTLALLNLQLRGEEVQTYLPRVLGLLESEDRLVRKFGRDALALVFTPLAKQIEDYNPDAPTDVCRLKVGELRKTLNQPSAPPSSARLSM